MEIAYGKLQRTIGQYLGPRLGTPYAIRKWVDHQINLVNREYGAPEEGIEKEGDGFVKPVVLRFNNGSAYKLRDTIKKHASLMLGMKAEFSDLGTKVDELFSAK